MYYNLITKALNAAKHNYNTVLPEEELKRFVQAYETGQESARIHGIKMQVKNLKVIKIFTISSSMFYTPTKLKEDIRKSAVVNNKGKLSIAVVRRFGEDITSKFIKGEWGEKKLTIKTPAIPVMEFINLNRIKELENIRSLKFDLTKLIKLCNEVNSSFGSKNYFAVGSICRAIIDHIPPVFGCKGFNEVANNYKAPGSGKSFSDSMKHLNDSMRKISDKYLHSQITSKETLPNETQVDCKRDLDVLLEEIVRILK